MSCRGDGDRIDLREREGGRVLRPTAWPRALLLTVHDHSVLLPGRLLREAGALHSLRAEVVLPGRLLREADSVHSLRTEVVLPGRLLPEADAGALPTVESGVLSLRTDRLSLRKIGGGRTFGLEWQPIGA